MRFIAKYLFIILCLLIISCNKTKQTQEEQTKTEYKNALYTSEELQQKAEDNQEFAKSKEYADQMQKVKIEMSKQTSIMNENEKLLLEFEVSLKKLKEFTTQIKENPGLSKDGVFMKRVLARADKVREYQQSLKKLNLNPIEKKKFQELCH
ncbi:MAG: hypothetical protein PHS59_11770 [Paludibacter sp.]|nr:hypothetical protein [Paludibacter sp.]